ncbi:collapsin Response Mediator Protein isoform X2 [Brevipalpus obovatus]|uniref:collapsin Response Mediator Protein isoform X2 n=1 Tax=Brevipalpus obovatus TaxID=246614 RepID=UPI003D9EB841
MDAPKRKIPIHVQSSQNRIVIRNGKCVNCDSIFDGDIFIEDGIIKQIGANLIVPGGCRIIDAKGHFVLPGGIDPHTHLEGTFMGVTSVDDFYHGTKAALAGGTTTIVNMPIDSNLGPLQLYEKFRALGDAKACCDYLIHPAIAKWQEGKTEKEMETLVKMKGVTSFKVFMAYKDSLMLEDHELIKVFDVCRRIGALPRIHAENGLIADFLAKKMLKMGINGPEGHCQSQPEELEAEAIHRASTLAHFVQAPLYIVHVMSKSAAEEVDRARQRGCLLFGEAVASSLGTDGSHCYNRCWRHASGHIMSPPLRTDKTTPDSLMNSLAAGSLECVGSDHIVFSGSQKAAGKDNFRKIPNGVNGVEERLMVVWEKGVRTGKLDPMRFVAVTSSNAAKLFNIYPKKGKIAVGSDADLVVWGKKPKVIKTESHLSRVDFNIFEGLHVEFSPIVVISNGVLVLDEEGKLTVSQGRGRYVECAPFAPAIYERVKNRERNVLPVKVDRSERPDSLKTGGTPSQLNGSAKNHTKTGNGSVEPSIVATNIHEVDSIPSTGPPSPALSTASSGQTGGFHRIQTRSGVRNLQDSSFKLSGEQIDDDRLGRTGIKVHNPPGGRSSGIF